VHEEDDLDEPIEPVADPEVCAACGSPDIYRTPRLLMFVVFAAALMGVGVAVDLTDATFLGVLALAVFFLILGRWHCSECGERWN
jgi:hypothetical protein